MKTKFIILIFLLLGACTRSWNEPLKIVFINTNNVWNMNTDGSEKTQLTFSGINNYPVYSPDCEKILFVRNLTQIWIMDAKGSNEQMVIDKIPLQVTSPTFSPDGKKITYVCNFNFIWIVDTDGGNDHEIFNNSGNSCNFLSWSPDGNWILFQRGAGLTMFKISANGGAPVDLLTGGNRGYSYSPDGNLIVGVNGSGGGFIEILSNQGVSLRTFNTGVFSTFFNNLDAAWSPDGQRIVFADNTSNIYIMNKDGSGLSLIATSASLPSFQGKPR